jgi:uncharacterized protein YndB with AHSA1/START domain
VATNSIHLSQPTEYVFDVLSDPYSYAEWVVGTSDITSADDDWPEPGSRFTWRAGTPPFQTRGQTEVMETDPPRRLVLRIGLPLGHIEIVIELHRQPDGTEVTLNECLSLPFARAISDPPLHLRNARALSQLKALVEARTRQGTRTETIPSLIPPPHWLDLPEYVDVVEGMERCYLAVSTKRGPHVTPTAFTSSNGRIWLFANRSSLKVRMLSRDPRAGILIRDGNRSVVMWGEAIVLDPAKLWRPEHLVERAYALPAIARYAFANKSRIGGYVTSSLSSFFELDPAARVLVSIAPTRLILLEGAEVTDQRGPAIEHLSAAPTLSDQRGEEIDLDDIPDSIAQIVDGNRVPAALGWEGHYGPAALPARWHETRNLVSVPAVLLDDVTESAVALSMDEDDGPDLDDQKGLMIRGQGRVVGRRGDYAAISIEQERTTIWEGAYTSTVDA